MTNGIRREFMQWPLIAILSMSVLLALVVPPLWIQSILGIDALLRAIVEAVPALQEYVRRSSFPDVAVVYFPVMVLISPLHFVWILKTIPKNFWIDQFASSPIGASLRLFAVLVLTALIGFVSYFEGGGQSEIIPWNESRYALALAGSLPSGGGFFIALATLVLGTKAMINRWKIDEA